ncbi:hypothetical protein VNI00_015218 [Paramarasmius palmivorus]|uniref:Uncharacterized protein n=1 Tax=Paramarasmius palmivorus TaxID=297713 RepID=A0AAW0BPQ6_9AGAR
MERLTSYNDMHLYLRAYISDQYNILHSNLTSNNTFYKNWNSTHSGPLHITQRLSVISTLLAGIGMPEVSPSNNTDTEPIPMLPTSPGGEKKKVAVTTIVGSVVGAITLITLVTTASVSAFRYYRKKHAAQRLPEIEPFNLRIQDAQQKDLLRSRQVKGQGGIGVSRPGERMERRHSSPAQLASVYNGEDQSGQRELVVAEVTRVGQERDSGWRPSVSTRRLPPPYDDAL